MNDALLLRIAEALERLSPPPAKQADMLAHPAYHWNGTNIEPVIDFAPLPFHLIVGVDRQREYVLVNARCHASGYAAHDVLLWGARGMGKSVLVKSVTAKLQAEALPIAVIEANAAQIETLPLLLAKLRNVKRQFILFIDDIAFHNTDNSQRMLRSMLEGGAEARPSNVRFHVTSNHRNIIDRRMAESESDSSRDNTDDSLALADRFGLKLGFQYPDQAGYLEMVTLYADHFNLSWDKEDALSFAHSRGTKSGRVAWHYTVELAGRAGKAI